MTPVRTGPPPVLCRVCGGPGRLYLSGQWCSSCCPHPPQPTPPPHGLSGPFWDRPVSPGPDAVTAAPAPLSADGAALVRRALGNAAKAPRHAADPYVRDGARVTSQAAAMKLLPRSGTQRRRVLDALVDAHQRGYGGATDPEVARLLELGGNSVRPRRGELVEMGLVEDSGRVRRHEGNDHAVWRPTGAALAALHVLPPVD